MCRDLTRSNNIRSIASVTKEIRTEAVNLSKFHKNLLHARAPGGSNALAVYGARLVKGQPGGSLCSSIFYNVCRCIPSPGESAAGSPHKYRFAKFDSSSIFSLFLLLPVRRWLRSILFDVMMPSLWLEHERIGFKPKPTSDPTLDLDGHCASLTFRQFPNSSQDWFVTFRLIYCNQLCMQ